MAAFFDGATTIIVLPVVGDDVVRGGQHRGLPGPGGALDQHQRAGAGDRPDRGDLPLPQHPLRRRPRSGQPDQRGRDVLHGGGLVVDAGADREPADDVAFQVDHLPGR